MSEHLEYRRDTTSLRVSARSLWGEVEYTFHFNPYDRNGGRKYTFRKGHNAYEAIEFVDNIVRDIEAIERTHNHKLEEQVRPIEKHAAALREELGVIKNDAINMIRDEIKGLADEES